MKTGKEIMAMAYTMHEMAEELKREAIIRRLKELEFHYGSIRAVGRAIEVDHAYLTRLRNGTKNGPSEEVLIKLGLLEEPTYAPAT